MNKDTLQDMRVMTIEMMKKIIEGCSSVRQEKNLHKDAKDLALLIIKDCRNVLLFLEGDDL
jgi:hypothetical protein